MLVAIVDKAHCNDIAFVDAVARSLDDGVDRVVLRLGPITAEAQLDVYRSLLANGVDTARLWLNGAPELLPAVLRAEVGGAHLRASQLDVVAAMTDAGYVSVGASVHNLAELQRARGASYVIVSPVYAPRSKSGVFTTLGVARLKALVDAAPMPVFALGGIAPVHFAELAGTGVAGVAALSPFCRLDRSEARAMVLAAAATRWNTPQHARSSL